MEIIHSGLLSEEWTYSTVINKEKLNSYRIVLLEEFKWIFLTTFSSNMFEVITVGSYELPEEELQRLMFLAASLGGIRFFISRVEE